MEPKVKWTRRESIKRTVSLRRKPNKPSLVTKMSYRETIKDVVAEEMHSQSVDVHPQEGSDGLKLVRWYSPDDISYNNREESLDSARSVDAGGYTPTDPFYLQCLSTRISMAQQTSVISGNPIAAPVANSEHKKQVQGQWQMAQEAKPGEVQIVSPSASYDEKTTNPEILKLQALPRPLRSRRMSRGVPWLPTIPEISAFKLKPVEFYDRTVNSPPLSKQVPEAYVILPSTPFTMTAPLFRHGPIRINRKIPDYSIISPLDEALDWTAFQMAILGTMDDNGGDQRDDWEWVANEKELDDLVVWFESFGFEGYGRLEGLPHYGAWAEVDNKSVISRSTCDVLEQNRRFFDDSLCGDGPDLSRDAENTELRGLYLGLSERRYSVESSLPESPMLDILTPCPNSNEEEKIPMGYNLGHDLGDFLHWEIKHAQFFGQEN